MNKLGASQVEKLIDLIQKNPVIFDKSDTFYKSVSLKDKIWQDIANSVGAEENECKTAWKSLRTQFVKAIHETKRNGQGSVVKKRYKYYDQLLFLKDSVRPSKNRRTPSNIEQLIEYDVHTYDDTDMFEKTEDEAIEEIKLDPICKISTPRSTPSPRPSKRRKSTSDDKEHLKEFLSAIVSEIKSSNETRESPDEIQTFFAVIANMVRDANLTSFQNRQMQKKVFNFVSEEIDKFEEEANK